MAAAASKNALIVAKVSMGMMLPHGRDLPVIVALVVALATASHSRAQPRWGRARPRPFGLPLTLVNCQCVHHRMSPLAMGSAARVGFRFGAVKVPGDTRAARPHQWGAGARLAGLPFLVMRP